MYLEACSRVSPFLLFAARSRADHSLFAAASSFTLNPVMERLRI